MKRFILGCLSIALTSTLVGALTPEDIAALDQLEGKNVPVMLTFRDVELSKVVQALGASAGFEPSFYRTFKDVKVTVDWRDLSVKEALIKLAEQHGLAYKASETNRLIVKARAETGVVWPLLDKPASEEERLLGFAVGGIESGLERSPDDYVAALLETVGPKQCTSHNDEEICFHEAKVVELYATKGNDIRKGITVRMLGSGSIGSRTLFFAVPAEPQLTIYGGTYGSAKAGEEEKVLFLKALRTAGLRQDA